MHRKFLRNKNEITVYKFDTNFSPLSLMNVLLQMRSLKKCIFFEHSLLLQNNAHAKLDKFNFQNFILFQDKYEASQPH